MKTKKQTPASQGKRESLLKGNTLKLNLVTVMMYIAGFAGAQTVTTLAGSTLACSSNGISSSAGFHNPFGITTDSSGNLYVADVLNNEIRKIVIATGAVSTLAGSSDFGSNDGTGTSAQFNGPTGIVYDGNGNLYVADNGNDEIRKIVISTGVVTTIAGSTLPGNSDDTGSAASFNAPYGITSDGKGNLYVADTYNNEIRQIVIATGTVSTLAGSLDYGNSDGTGTGASFASPMGIAADGNGNLYIADADNNEIRKIVISTAAVTTIAGSGEPGYFNGTGVAARFNAPYGIVADGKGNLYIADTYNNEIRKIVIETGTVSTFAGSTTAGSENGVGTSASFNSPAGITSDANGNLYVADRDNNEIRMIDNLYTGINSIAATNQLSVYPNPASEKININMGEQFDSSPVSLKIFDMSGKEVMNTTGIINNDKTVTTDVSPLVSGNYLVQMLMANNSTVTAKFAKQ